MDGCAMAQEKEEVARDLRDCGVLLLVSHRMLQKLCGQKLLKEKSALQRCQSTHDHMKNCLFIQYRLYIYRQL